MVEEHVEELSIEEHKAIQELSVSIAEALAKGTSKDKIVKELVKEGWHRETAIQFVNQIEDAVNESVEQYKASPEGRRLMANKYKRHMLFGSLWVIGGTIVTIATYNAASEGGVYFVFWGAIIFGAIDFLYGLVRWLEHR